MRYFFSVLLVTLFCLPAFCQAPPVINFDELVVKDSSGALISKEQWQKLVSTGQYSMKISPDTKSATLIRSSQGNFYRKNGSMPGPMASPYFTTGEKIRTFSERDITGTKWDLKKMQGKVVVLNFWFINCSPCRMEMPELNNLVATYKDNNDVVFLAIAFDSWYDIKEFLKTTPYDYHIISDGRYITDRYGIRSYPTNVVIDKQGKVAFHTTAYSSQTVSAIKNSIDEALAKMYY